MGRRVEAGVGYLDLDARTSFFADYYSITPRMSDLDRSLIVNQSGRLLAVRELEDPGACLSQT
jgi:hypothetical protein